MATEKITGREYLAQLDNQINEIENRLFKNRSYISMAPDKMIQYHKDRFVSLLLERHDLQRELEPKPEPKPEPWPLPYLGKIAMPAVPVELSGIQGGVDASCCQGQPSNAGPAQSTLGPTYTVQIYLDNGVVFQYSVHSDKKAREHAAAIVKDGYRHNDGVGEFEHYPAHRITKVKISGVIPTLYPDTAKGT